MTPAMPNTSSDHTSRNQTSRNQTSRNPVGTTTGSSPPGASARSPLRAVALPNEHGGWGLTAEPVVLGLLIGPSVAGACLGAAAVLAFLARTPVKLLSIDVRHGRRGGRSRLAAQVAAVELTVVVLLGIAALLLAGWAWLVPVAVAAPFVGVEWWYDSRGRGRRLVPELSGAVGIAAVAAAVVLAGDGPASLAVGAWLVLAARAVGSIPFVRTQILRLRRGTGSVRRSDAWQAAAVAVAVGAAAVEPRVIAGSIAVIALAALQCWWMRRPPVPPKRLGFTQLGLGVGLVVVTAVGAALV